MKIVSGDIVFIDCLLDDLEHIQRYKIQSRKVDRHRNDILTLCQAVMNITADFLDHVDVELIDKL